MNMDATYPVRFTYFGIWSMPEMRMVLISLDRQRKYQMINFTLYSMNNDDKMRYLWTINPNIAKEGIHILIDDLIESDTIRLLDWNDNMIDIQLGMNWGKWREYILSCSHTLAVCREKETYRRTYQSNFYQVGHENFWRDALYNLTFYLPSMNNQLGRKQGTRFRGEMDYRNPNSPPRCSRY
ncbi:hypothetical protein M9H77_08075 [Catharanthus roseus]|uniref:Uncharacterized protein n=1 Tax=Catharanthus roseus TaxID=4058 RepID=A0ACC0BWS3_CATRO|nr:hypothetical protein M9H77_08075 [Catharanthus roseus]